MRWNRDLRLLAGAVFLSSAGDLLALIVLALRVHELTGSGLAVSALFAATLVPAILVAPVAGLATDRFESVRVLVIASLVQAVVASGLAFSTDLVVILALTCVLTASNAFGQPAEFTLVPAVADERDVAAATGAVEAARYAGFAVGPFLAAGLAAVGSRSALLVNAASFLAIAIAAAAMRTRRRPTPVSTEERSRAMDGFRLLRRDRVLGVTLGAGAGALLFISAALTVEIFYIKDVVGASDTGYALLVGVWMAGMVCGAATFARRVPARLFAVGTLVALAGQGAGMAVQTTWAILPVAFGGYLIGGLGHGAKNVLQRALITARVPDALRGRAFAANNAVCSVAELCAVGAGGLLVTALGPRTALLVAGLGPVVAGTVGLAALRRGPGATAPVPRAVSSERGRPRATVAGGT
jgi:Na+/melibiose symporter-like transporter